MRALLRSTGKPPQWTLVGFLLAGLAVGVALGAVLGPREVAVLTGLTAGVIACTGMAGRPATVARLGVPIAVGTVLFVWLGFATSGSPWAAAIATALVAILTSAMASAGLVGQVLGPITTLTYVIALLISSETSATQRATSLDVAVRLSAVALAGLLVALAGAALRSRGAAAAGAGRSPAPEPTRVVAPADPGPGPWSHVATSVRTVDAHTRDGVRRAIPLAGCVFWYETTGSHDVLWVLVAVLAVIVPTGKSALAVAAARVAATLIGVVAITLAAQVVPTAALVVVAVALVALSLAYKPVYPLLAGAASAFSVVAFAGAPTADIVGTATHRLVDTLAGVAIALAATFLLWPRDVPEDAAAAGSAT